MSTDAEIIAFQEGRIEELQAQLAGAEAEITAIKQGLHRADHGARPSSCKQDDGGHHDTTHHDIAACGLRYRIGRGLFSLNDFRHLAYAPLHMPFQLLGMGTKREDHVKSALDLGFSGRTQVSCIDGRGGIG